MSVLHLPARTEPLALTSLVITSANVWLHLKVMSTEGMVTKKKLINFTYYYFHLSNPHHLSQQNEYIFICHLWLNKENLSTEGNVS